MGDLLLQVNNVDHTVELKNQSFGLGDLVQHTAHSLRSGLGAHLAGSSGIRDSRHLAGQQGRPAVSQGGGVGPEPSQVLQQVGRHLLLGLALPGCRCLARLLRHL